MRYLKTLRAFVREFHDITEHARTGRRPQPPETQPFKETRAR